MILSAMMRFFYLPPLALLLLTTFGFWVYFIPFPCAFWDDLLLKARLLFLQPSQVKKKVAGSTCSMFLQKSKKK